jgi:cellulose biosynthesis protein BcsQ
MWDRVTRESALQIEAMADSGLRVWPPIPVDVRVREAARHGLTLVEYQPRTRAMVGVRLNGSGLVGGYVKVARELLEEL